MKKKIVTTGIIMLLITTLVSLPLSADEEPMVSNGVEMEVSVFGASVLTGVRQIGFSLRNSGGNPNAETIEDITFTFTVQSITDDEINFSYSDDIASMAYNEGSQFLTNAISGYGPVELTLTASSSNTEAVSKSIKGYQIGPITLSQSFLLSELLR